MVFRTRKKCSASVPPGVDLDAGITTGSRQLLPTFSKLFAFRSEVAKHHLFRLAVICLLLAVAPAWLSKSCVFFYVIRGACTREMNKHQRSYAGS